MLKLLNVSFLAKSKLNFACSVYESGEFHLKQIRDVLTHQDPITWEIKDGRKTQKLKWAVGIVY